MSDGHSSARAFDPDDRAQALQVGLVFVLAIVVVSFSLFQATVVPQQNEEDEFEHNQRVQRQLENLRDAALETGRTGNANPTTVTLGTRYRARTLGMNPPPATGYLRTVPGGEYNITNATARGLTSVSFADIVADNYTTKAIRYTPRYNEYTSAPETVYATSVLYNRQDGAFVAKTNQTLIDGSVITLPVLRGDFSESGTDSRVVDLRPVSAPATTVVIENQSEGITLTVPTNLSESTWNDLLASELSNGNVSQFTYSTTTVQSTDAIVRIFLEPGRYELRTSVVGVGSVPSDVDDPFYITNVSGNNTVVPEGGRQKLSVEVRDRFNNPVSGNLTSSDLAGAIGSFQSGSETTDANGQASFVYKPPDNVDGQKPVRVFITFGGNDSNRQRVAFELDVLDSDDSGGPTLLSVSADDLTLDSSSESQTFGFTLDGGLASGDTVTIDLSDATGGQEVSYGAASASVTSGSGSAQVGGNGKSVTYTAGSSDTDGSTITIEVSDVDTTGNKASGTYDAVFTRDDSGASKTAQFTVGQGLSGATVDDLQQGQSSTQQGFSFTLEGAISDGQTVTIDLSDATGGNKVDYKSASATVATGSGSASVANNGKEITYTAGPADNDGDTIDIQVSDVDTSGSRASGTYDVIFTRDDSGASITRQFNVN